MRINLTRPIAFIDIEATGISRESDRIVEISICKLHPNGTREVKTRRINPEIPIPAGATEIHGISDDDVANESTFKDVSKSLLAFIAGCDLGGYNSNSFDFPMLFNEFLRAGIYWNYKVHRFIDAGNIFKIQEQRTLTAAYKFYCGKDLEGAHGAEADINATVDVFLAQLERYEDVPGDIEQLHLFCNYGKPILDLSGKFTYDESNNIIFNFGPKKGLKAEDHLDFVEWMVSRDFPQDTMQVCYQLLNYNY